MGWSMSRWKELPSSLDQRVRQLVVQMRRMKDHSGLSLAALAGRTGYSRSSWERYLNGKQLPPRQAVEELARACEAEPSRLLVLHELAEQSEQSEQAEQLEDSEQAGQAERSDAAGEPSEPESRGGPAAKSGRRGLWVALSLVVVCAVAGAGLLAARPWQDDDKGGDPRSEQAEYVYEPGRTYTCDVHREDGKLYAGRSDTDRAVLQQSTTSWAVVEAQCLLNHHGFEHGEVDGVYGNLTERAVKRFQKAHREEFGLVIDGKVGQHTWEALRD